MVRCSILAFAAVLSSFAIPALAGPVRDDGRGISARATDGLMPGYPEVLVSCAMRPLESPASDYATTEITDNLVSTMAARAAGQQSLPDAASHPSASAIINPTTYVPVCIITALSRDCIAAGNAFCSSTGLFNPKDTRCARACNCVRL